MHRVPFHLFWNGREAFDGLPTQAFDRETNLLRALPAYLVTALDR